MKSPNILKFKVRLTPLTPVHIGCEESELAHYYLDTKVIKDKNFHYAYPLKTRALSHVIAERLGFITDTQNISYTTEEKQRITKGELSLRSIFVAPQAVGLLKQNQFFKPCTTNSRGLPYIPGSSVKGALRTAWLVWLLQNDPNNFKEAYQYLDAINDFDLEKRKKREHIDDALQKDWTVAESFVGTSERANEQNRDFFRAVRVSDFEVEHFDPTKSNHQLTALYSVQPMSYTPNKETRRANRNGATPSVWECLRPPAKQSYVGTLTVDIDLLSGLQTRNSIAKTLLQALQKLETWQEAISVLGTQTYEHDSEYYFDILPQHGIDLKSIQDKITEIKNSAEKILPLGMGTGFMNKSILGAWDSEEKNYLGKQKKLLQVLKTSPMARGQGFNQTVAQPKSRRVIGNWKQSRTPLPELKAEQPLGWVKIELTEHKETSQS